MENRHYDGAKLERGIVRAAEEQQGGGFLYAVESLDRPGVMTGRIPSLGQARLTGDLVYFALYNDGTGMIIAKIGGESGLFDDITFDIDQNGHLVVLRTD